MKILVAEDDNVSNLVVSKSLERLGHEVASTHDGAEAWRRFQDERFVVIISDWMMPQMDGLQLCNRVRTGGFDSYTYFILLTARTQRDDRLQALAGEVDDFLTKPLDRMELAARLRTAERIISWQRQLEEMNAALRSQSAALAEQARELELLREQAEYLAAHDGLTGTLNRRAWFDAARRVTLQAAAIFDIDHFKGVNDRYGHPTGDAIIREVGARLERSVGADALVGRIGGEEFAVGFTVPFQEALQLCEQAVAAISQEPVQLPRGVPLTVSISGGVAGVDGQTGPTGEALLASLYDAADRALYRAKAAGRARIVAESGLAA